MVWGFTVKTLLVASAIAVLAGLSFASGALAEDMYVEDTQFTEMASPSEWGFYSKAYGGLIGAGTVSIGAVDEYATEVGRAAGLAVGVETPIKGFAIELDLLWTEADLATDPVTVTSISVMADLVYTLDLNETFGVYGGAGLGFIRLYDTFDGPTTFDDTQLGYQVMIGAIANLTQNFAITGEVRWQDSFGTYANMFSPGHPVSYGTTSALVGIKVSTD